MNFQIQLFQFQKFQFELKSCTEADVEPYSTATNYVPGDIVRVNLEKFKCKSYPFRYAKEI